ncbi:MAG: 2-succinyl-6-hydroxy-2,4-cyclohexadiene-1-carboxylate synthase [Baekduiaceae bacterium]
MSERLVLLHGFTQTGRSWDGVVAALGSQRYTALAPDLRGHGAAAGARPITFEAITRDVLALGGDRCALAGYSMGGRIALHVALAAPARISRLVLVATTAGIADDEERAARRAADDALAARIEAQPVEEFARDWGAQPLFADQSPEVRALAHADRLRNEPAGLAASLRGVGTGAMAPLWDRLDTLTMPVEVIVGERDAKFRAIGERLHAAFPRARLTVVRGAGHAVPLEAPAAVAEVLDADVPPAERD